MAIRQTISLDGLQQVTQELKNLADVGESAFGRIRAAVEGGGGGLEAIANNILKVGSALTSLTGAVTVFAGITAGLVGLAVSASNAGEEFENLGAALGTSTEEASALISSFARAGADIEGLAQSLRRGATNIAQEFARIQESVRGANLKTISNNLAVTQSVNNLAKATSAAADEEQKAALQRQANSFSVLDAQNRLDDLLEKQRIAQGGVRDPQREAEVAALRQEEEIAKARLAVSQAIQKAKQDEADAAQKAADQAIAVETAQLALAKARQQAAEDQKNSIANLVGFVNELSQGITNSGREINRTVDNIFTGIVASAGGVKEAIGEVQGGFSNAIPPTVLQVLLKTADVMKNLTTNTERQALATKLLGRAAGQELVTFLSQGGQAIQDYIKKVEGLGLVFSTVAAEKTQEFRRALFTLEDTLIVIKNQIGATFAPTFTPFFNLLNDALTTNRLNFLVFAQVIANAVQPVLESIIRVLQGAPDQIKDQWLLDLIDKFTRFAEVIKTIVVPVFKTLIDAVQFVADEINGVFGTKLDAVSLLFVVWLGKIFGVFALFRTGLELLGAALVAFGIKAGLALSPILLAFTAGFAAVLGILALTDKATFDALSGLGNRLADLGEKIVKNFTDPQKEGADETSDAWKKATEEVLHMESEALKAGQSGKKAGDDTAAAFDKAKQSIGGAAQAATQASGSFGKFVPEVFKGTPTASVVQGTLAGGDVTRQTLGQFGAQGQQAAPQQTALQETTQRVSKVAQDGGQAAVAAFQAAADQIEAIWNSLIDSIDASTERLSGLFTGITDEFVGPFLDAEETVDAVFDGLASKAQDMSRKIVQAANDAAQALAAIGGGSGGGLSGDFGLQFAGGGHVQGPGGPTGDRIAAWLSDDEFVQPANRVMQYGLDFMEAIRRGLLSTDAVRMLMGDMRGFRHGGMTRVPSFAGGGHVTSGSQRTLNLVLDGQSFPLSGQPRIIDALEREASIRAMASTGIPQTFVGRRG